MVTALARGHPGDIAPPCKSDTNCAQAQFSRAKKIAHNFRARGIDPGKPTVFPIFPPRETPVSRPLPSLTPDPKLLRNFVPGVRLALTTNRSSGECSNYLSYPGNDVEYIISFRLLSYTPDLPSVISEVYSAQIKSFFQLLVISQALEYSIYDAIT